MVHEARLQRPDNGGLAAGAAGDEPRTVGTRGIEDEYLLLKKISDQVTRIFARADQRF